jgi:FixJ family two-component response regulator
MNIRVLWIDDDFKIQLDVIGHAEQDGIDLIPFESHEEGIDALMKDLAGFHAVILDAKVKRSKGDTKTGLDGLRASRDKLIELNNQGYYIPYFIYTGQPDYMDEDWFKESYGDFYIKGKDNQKLLDDIKEAVEKKDEYLIQKDYYPFFEVLQKHFDSETKELFTKILIGIKKNDLEYLLYFIQLRKILEKSFRILNKAGLLHDKCIKKGKVNLSESSLFLSGHPTKHLGIKCNKSHFPSDISSGVWDIISICGTEAHTEEELAKFLPRNSPYLFYSLTFRLLDILIWMDNYLIANPDYSINKSFWATIEDVSDNDFQTFIGEIAQDSNGNYHCEDYLLNKLYVEKHFKIGDKVKILESTKNGNPKTNIFYSKYANRFEKI